MTQQEYKVDKRYHPLLKRYGKWTVYSENRIGSRNQIKVWCKCDCGHEQYVLPYNLRIGRSYQCKYCPKEYRHVPQLRKTLRKRHIDIRNRCFNKANESFKNYGGRGITLCDEWKDFEKFYSWAVNNGFKPELTFERINNDGHYEPSNIRFATQKEQCQNKRNNIAITYNGVTLCASEWARKMNLPAGVILWRFKKGWKGADLFRKQTPLKRGQK